MKIPSPIWRGHFLACALACLAASSARAQTTSGIGSAPSNTPQHQILTTALSPATRQTLQEAMNSYPATPASSHPKAPAK